MVKVVAVVVVLSVTKRDIRCVAVFVSLFVQREISFYQKTK
jgi:hypothetical protein